jgi:hypothetical protein
VKLRRTALLGSESLCGTELVERLEAAHVDLGQLVMAEPGADAAVIQAIGSDLRLSTPRVEETLEGADLVLSCVELPDDARAEVTGAARRVPVVDLTGTLGGRPFDARRRDRGDRDIQPRGLDRLGAGLHESPSGAALVLAALLRSAGEAGARGPLVAVVLEPASELGKPALDELYQQAVATLNFTTLPTEVFGRQAVHDVSSPGPRGRPHESRLASCVARLAGGERPALLVVQPGIFHGVAIAARAAVDAAAWKAAMAREPRLLVDADAGLATPLAAVRAENAVVGRVESDGAGGAWAWVAADTLTQGAVGNVVELLAEGAARPADESRRTP